MFAQPFLLAQASGFSNAEEEDYYDTDGTSLFHIKGTDDDNTKASQVDEKTVSLNSGDCFVLLTPGRTTLWEGQFASDSEVNVAKTIASLMNGKREMVEVKEGSEASVAALAAFSAAQPYFRSLSSSAFAPSLPRRRTTASGTR